MSQNVFFPLRYRFFRRFKGGRVMEGMKTRKIKRHIFSPNKIE